jgi:inosine/xanthosine triphosphate pyrophosphatase family protein
MKIFFATSNKAKWSYFKKWFKGFENLEILTPFDIDKSLWPEIDEKGNTLQDNAEIKAIAWSKVVPNVFVLANDCGVDVPGLGDKWKLEWTKRSTGNEDTKDLDRMKTFLSMMEGLHGEDRKIQWLEGISLAKNGTLLNSILVKSHSGYIIEKLPENPVIIEGAPLATLEYRSEYGKVYSEMTDDEIADYEKESYEIISSFIQKVLEK